jgi:hypothetical protein
MGYYRFRLSIQLFHNVFSVFTEGGKGSDLPAALDDPLSDRVGQNGKVAFRLLVAVEQVV